MWMWSTGINRNIVECKDGHGRVAERLNDCINRNIVECKDHTGSEYPFGKTGINRNIVECKVLIAAVICSVVEY